MLFIFYNYILHFIFSYTPLLINKFKRHFVTLRHCQLYIKAVLSYSLKLASWKPKHVAAMFFQLIIFYVIKLCWTAQLYISIKHHCKHNCDASPKTKQVTAFWCASSWNLSRCLASRWCGNSFQTDRQTDRQLVQCAFRLPVYCCVVLLLFISRATVFTATDNVQSAN